MALRDRVTAYLAGNVTCNELTEAVTEYREGNMPFIAWVRFQMHLGMCLGCRRYLKQMKHTVEALGRLPEPPIPPAVREELSHRFRTWKTNRAR